MNRTARKAVVTTALMAIGGVLLWLFWMGDPCLYTDIANHWTAKNPPEVAPTPSAGSNDFVVVENPYGIMTCDHWPTPAEDVLTASVFAIICFAIGWLAARRIPHRPLFAAAAITTVAMLTALVLQYWAQWERVEFYFSGGRPDFLRFELLAMLLFLLIAAGIAMLGAWVATRFTRRA